MSVSSARKVDSRPLTVPGIRHVAGRRVDIAFGKLLLGLAGGTSTSPLANFKEFTPPWKFHPW